MKPFMSSDLRGEPPQVSAEFMVQGGEVGEIDGSSVGWQAFPDEITLPEDDPPPTLSLLRISLGGVPAATWMENLAVEECEQ